ncbi:MAG: HNH endonuclease [Neisseriaceae bacterium]|nr:MAG: HNH endonuclease [Neisseriaceae bacterium]
MTQLTYLQQLRHPNWQRRRLEALNLADFTCQRCFGTEKPLHVHHKQYIKGRLAWEYGDSELIVLCDSCHDHEHALLEGLKLAIANSWQRPEDIASVVSGMSMPFAAGQDGLQAAAALIDNLRVLSADNLIRIHSLAVELFGEQMAENKEGQQGNA